MESFKGFDYTSLRAREARLAHHIAPAHVSLAFSVLSLAAAVSGPLMVWFLETSTGWLIAGASGLFFMAAVFSNRLQNIPLNKPAKTIDDVLDVDLLGILPQKHTPKDLAGLAMHLTGGRFFAGRFGLGIGWLSERYSNEAVDAPKVWQQATKLAAESGLPNVSAATLTAALILSIPDVDRQLAVFRLSAQDIRAGLDWYNQLLSLYAAHRTRSKHEGGLGRDWAFGYTPVLSHFGVNISTTAAPVSEVLLPSRDAINKQVMHLLSQAGRRNATLVGGLGSGKTMIVHSLAQKLSEAHSMVPPTLRFWQVVSLDPSAIIAQARGRGEVEGLVQNLCKEASLAKNTILFFDDAHLFFENANGAVDIANVLLPVLDGGALPIIFAMDEQSWLRVSQANPSLAQYLNRINVPPTDESETMKIMQDEFALYEYQEKVTYTYQALQAAYQLSSRYISEQVMPGRALKLLEAAAGRANDDGIVTQASVEKAIEQTMGIKVGIADTEDERRVLMNLEQLIHERMINQTRAVQVVSDALRRARAGVHSVKRPIGTFLFLGPTGVGKTELAKSVAAVFFGGEDHMVRVDLNEFVRPEDVSRLIADGSSDPHSLVAQIRKNPFSVVLLDEIEKAHPSVLSTLLQMLDEGILRDIANREVSFRDAVIVATSNAGSDRIRQHIEAGQKLEQFEDQFVNELINSKIFTPEFLNRFDEVVLFRPLNPDELVKVVDIMIKGINQDLTSQKVSVLVDEDAKQLLVKTGYDPRLGARPMRRIVQRVVENIVSRQLLSAQVVPGSKIQINLADVQEAVSRERHED